MPFTSAVVADASAVADTLLRPPTLGPFKQSPAVSFLDHRDVFVCDEESSFYSACLEDLVFGADQHSDFESVIEFGSGDGWPVLNALGRTDFGGVVNGCADFDNDLAFA